MDRLAREQAFTVLNRLAAIRMAEKRDLVVESVGKGYQSKGFQVFERVAGAGLGETYQRYCRYLFCLFDELAVDLVYSSTVARLKGYSFRVSRRCRSC